MKWYKHYSDMSNDVKIKRVIRKYGAEGYALYNYVLELIVRKLDKDSPLPDLEESSADVAYDLNMDTLKVEEIMWYCVEQGLFEQDELTGRLTAHKIYKFLDKAQTRSPEIKMMIDNYSKHKQLPDKTEQKNNGVNDCHGQPETVGTRVDKSRVDKSREGAQKKPDKSKDSDKVKHEITGRPISPTRYTTLVTEYGQETVDEYIQKIADWCDAKGKEYKDFAAAAANWIKKDIADGKSLRKSQSHDNINLIANKLKEDV